uniref:ComEC/Rec2 family competence protein n=1 Tax=candidate division WWE3 bacterium TaxID=2053526 RepID=A0A7C4TLJ8_UNCKA
MQKRNLSLLFLWLIFLAFNIDIGSWVGEKLAVGGYIDRFSKEQNEILLGRFKQYLPSPHLEIFLGMVLGSESIKRFSRFNDVMINSGMIHAIVASGYNINLVFTFLFKIFGSKFVFNYLLIAQIFAFIYAVITGFNIPIIRAIIMVSVIHWASFSGYRLRKIPFLINVALIMLCFSPNLYTSLSFIYSFGSTFGLVLSSYLSREEKYAFIGSFKESFMAQVLVIPLSWLFFGRFSLNGLLSTPLLGSLVVLITVAGFMSCLGCLVSDIICEISLIPIYFMMAVFLYVCEKISEGVNMSNSISIMIYVFVLLLIIWKEISYSGNGVNANI